MRPQQPWLAVSRARGVSESGVGPNVILCLKQGAEGGEKNGVEKQDVELRGEDAGKMGQELTVPGVRGKAGSRNGKVKRVGVGSGLIWAT